MSTPDEFAQLQLNFIDPFQHQYEVIRPVVLFGETVAARSRQTWIERTQISEKARRFVEGGMLALADMPSSGPSQGAWWHSQVRLRTAAHCACLYGTIRRLVLLHFEFLHTLTPGWAALGACLPEKA